MPTPKFKKSNSKRNQRRAHDALKVGAMSYCPNCNEAKQPHNVCLACGHYKGKQVMEPRNANLGFEGDDFNVEA